ncbi:MAG: phosphate ABC transporter substrate-binding/OmpA family protein [Pseudomonadota bacterium]
MAKLRVAIYAALLGLAGAAAGQDVTLTSPDGSVELSGNLLGFDGEFYRVDTIYGELTVDSTGVDCAGPGCPNLDAYVAEAIFSGAPAIGAVLMPALLEAFALRERLSLERNATDDGDLIVRLYDTADNREVGAFRFRLTTSSEAFADLVAHEADIAMSVREIDSTEQQRAEEAGLGDLSSRSQARVIALDALVPIVSPSNQMQSISLADLARVLTGDITNWLDLGGPDAPIAVHLMAPETGLGHATQNVLLASGRLEIAAESGVHRNGTDLAKAITRDPFAIGLTSQADVGENWPLTLNGTCGFALRADRRAVKTEDYPLTAPMFLYLPQRRMPRLLRSFLAFLQEPAAQLVVRRMGYIDQAQEEIAINEQGDRFANAVALAGRETGLDALQAMVETLKPLKRTTTTFRFETGSSRLDAQSRSNVARLARALETGQYDLRRLVFVGFSDGEGGAASNQTIALRRAQAVRDAVVEAAETANLTRVEIDVAAFGEAMPMACDDTEWGRRINRRVEVWVR